MSSARSRAVAWVAVGVLGGAIVTGTVVSQLSAATAATPSPAPGQAQQNGAGPRGGPGIGHLRGLGRVAHGELKVQTGPNTYRTVFVQNGRVTAVDTAAKKLTVKSTDGQSFTYATDGKTRIRKDGKVVSLSDLKTGDKVHVLALKASDGTLTARVVGSGHPAAGRFEGRMHRGWDREGAPQGTTPNGGTTQGSSSPRTASA